MRVDGPGWDGRRIVLDDELLDPLREELATLGAAPPARLAYAAPHLVFEPGYAALGHSPEEPGEPAAIAARIDLEGSMALRRRLDAHGLGVAEAMDTSQRFAIGWEGARKLIEATGALELGQSFMAGAGADQLAEVRSADELVEGVVEQARVIGAAGGVVVLLPLPWLSMSDAGQEEYVAVYSAIVEALEGPLVVHWLGEMFHPALSGYFPGDSFRRVMAHDPEKILGCKLSLLDANRERLLRRELLQSGQLVLSGDDLHFAELIRGGDGRTAPVEQGERELGGRRVPLGEFSHALLGILDGVAVPAGLALRFLSHGRIERYHELMDPCEELGRWLFQQPTLGYKAGLAFLGWVAGLQPNYMLANGEERLRSPEHLLRAVELGARAGIFEDVELVAARLEQYQAVLRAERSAGA